MQLTRELAVSARFPHRNLRRPLVGPQLRTPKPDLAVKLQIPHVRPFVRMNVIADRRISEVAVKGKAAPWTKNVH
jgi:hypothetical protein